MHQGNSRPHVKGKGGCFNCAKLGHFVRDCRLPRKNGDKGSKKAVNDSETGPLDDGFAHS